MTTKTPLIHEYLDAWQYLQDIYQSRKQDNQNFSYEIWAEELGVKNRSYLRLVVIGKRAISDEFISKFSKWMNFSTDETEHFSLLVLYTRSKTIEQKKMLGQRLLRKIKAQTQYPEIKDHTYFLSNTLLPKLQVLLSFNDLNTESSVLAKLLNQPEEAIVFALQKLESLNLATPVPILDKIQWKSRTSTFQVKEKLGDASLIHFHEQSLEEAKTSLRLDPKTRRLRTLLLPFSEKEFDLFRQNLETFFQETKDSFTQDQLEDRHLYQINFQVYPVTQK